MALLSEEQKTTKSLSVGVVLFDNSEVLTSGWYSLGEGAVRFSSPSVLPQSATVRGVNTRVFFVTNASYAAYKNDQLDKLGYARLQGFFKVSLRMVANEIGINLQSCDIREAVIALAKVLSRAWSFAEKSFEGILPLETVPEAILSHLGIRDNPDFSLLEPILSSAYQENSSVIGMRWEQGMLNYLLIPNRVRHAAKVLSFPYPSGAWEIRKDILSLDKALAEEKPIFVECDVVWKGAALSDLCAYGSQSIGVGRGNTSIREWVAQPELQFLAEHATSIKITGAAAWSDLALPPQLPETFTSSAFTPLSYSAGIVADSYLAALMSKGYSKKFRKYFHPVRATWMRSVDRAISFSKAKQLYESGVRVTSYGAGVVGVRAFPHELDELKAIAGECGFMLMSRLGGGE